MIKMSLVVLAGLVASALLRRRSASLRHWVLACTLVCAGAMPALEPVVPAWQGPITFAIPVQPETTLSWSTVEPGADGDSTPPASPAQGARSGAWGSLLTGVWAVGAILGLAALGVGLSRLAWITARARVVGDGLWAEQLRALGSSTAVLHPVTLLESDHPSLLVTWGVLRPAIVLPSSARTWPRDRVRAVLGHEVAHVRRHDWAIQMAAEVLRCVYWFNPLLWIACHRLRLDSEQACDDAVLNSGTSASDYASHLLDVARSMRARTDRPVFPVMAMARPSQLERRVRVMLTPHTNRSPLTRAAGLGTAALLLALTIPLAGLTTSTAPSTPAEPHTKASPVDSPAVWHQPATPSAPPSGISTPPNLAAARPALANRTAEATAGPATAARTAVAPQQPAPASLSGSLLDATGKTMPGVPIALVNPAAKERRESRTDDAGRFAWDVVAPGDYQVEIQKPGFKRGAGRIVVASGQALAQDLVAQIGSLSELIVVSAGTRPTSAAPAASPLRVTPVSRPLLNGRVEVVFKETPLPPDPCANSPVGGCITPPTKIVDAKPQYPQTLADEGVSGDAVIEGVLGTDGYLKDLRPVNIKDSRFADAATAALEQWRFVPARLNGVPQECRITVTVKFVVEQD